VPRIVADINNSRTALDAIWRQPARSRRSGDL
jgi:hypothetical protein